ncbi:hypothetical protein YC2023_073111 [Brassica napus]
MLLVDLDLKIKDLVLSFVGGPILGVGVCDGGLYGSVCVTSALVLSACGFVCFLWRIYQWRKVVLIFVSLATGQSGEAFVVLIWICFLRLVYKDLEMWLFAHNVDV